jgi:hypothetical protein
MAAWASSPYRALGVYIGGANRACSQPNLTPAWVSAQVSDGWRLIPTYVGLQSPTSSCGSCAKLSPAAAASQGSAAADDAARDADAVGIGPGSPIYFDMEAYTRTSTSTDATLTFLAAWTSRLHVLGYVSGVYSSSASGVTDLAQSLGSGYTEPDDIWIANWNGRQSSDDPALPANAWSSHQRLHQYRGGHDETYGGVTINIDNDYVEGATAGVAAVSEDPKGALSGTGSPRRGWVRIVGWAFDPSAPTEAVSIRASVGGTLGGTGVASYELGPIATRPRPDLAASHAFAGTEHGFDATIPTVMSGPQRVCVYAIDLGLGSDKLLGCRRTGIRVAIRILRLRALGRAMQVRIRCEWPAGTQCPGRLILRAQVSARGARRHSGGGRVVRVRLGRRRFHLVGERAHTFRLALSGRGQRLVALRGRLRSQLLIAIPGGRLIRALLLGG